MKLTKKGYQELLNEIAEKEEELRSLGIYKGKEAVEHGDVWHDNHSFEQAEIKERSLIHTISKLKSTLEDVEIIDSTETFDNVVNIGSTVEVELIFSSSDSERITVTISGDYNINNNDVISVNSPLATAILGKSEGFSGFYLVNGRKINVKILKITS